MSVVIGWKIYRIGTNGRAVPLTPRLFTIKDAALEYARLAGDGAYIVEVCGVEPLNDGRPHRRTAKAAP